MPSTNRIRTPWRHKLRRFSQSVMPVLCFLVCLAVLLWFWNRQGQVSNAVGAVEPVRLDIAALTDGTLLPLQELPNGEWQLLDVVRKNEVIARLDDRAAREAVQALRQEVVSLEKELDATEAQAMSDEYDRRHDHHRHATELACQIERYRLEVLNRRALIEENRIEVQRIGALLEYLEPLGGTPGDVALQIADYQLQHDLAAKRFEENTTAFHEAQEQWKAAVQRQKTNPPVETPDTDMLLAPIRASIGAQEALIRELEAEIDALEIRAPVNGSICAIYYRPGQHVRAGEPILTIAADTDRKYVMSYIPREQYFRPTIGMTVDVRVRAPGSLPVTAEVDQVGSQIEPLPLHLVRDPTRSPNMPEWGLPVRILLPSGFDVRPGELVDISFKPSATSHQEN
ncbi:MAG TPA: HlyD family efflux transporter periplasmic adaptor subunit [Thermoguttaceae bacterium]|nr:HlyD family efflux transporter periplasmic adaptor subunit [Thermoguttaceae bacterium]